MVTFPYEIGFGLAIVLAGTIAFIVYVLTLDQEDLENATQERLQPENDQQEYWKYDEERETTETSNCHGPSSGSNK
jgi:hypothetical protein